MIDENKQDTNTVASDREQPPDLNIPEKLPLLGLPNVVLYPFMIHPTVADEDAAKQLVDSVVKGDRLLGVFLRKDPEGQGTPDNLHDVGCLGVVLKMLRMPDGSVRLLLHGIQRVRITEVLAAEPFPLGRVEPLHETGSDSTLVQRATENARQQARQLVGQGRLPEEMLGALDEITEPSKTADLICSHIEPDVDVRQQILETTDIQERIEKVLELLSRESELADLDSTIRSKTQVSLDKSQREYVLRQQMKAIREELGEGEENADVAELAEQIEKAGLPEHARDAADRELKRLRMLHASSPEYTVSRNYLDWIVSLPWSSQTQDNTDIDQAEEVLDEDHYDLEDVKERILEHLAVIHLKQEIRGPILCFVGPPGVGKTSLGRSIARALGRKFARISLGGMHDEAEIRGHRRTYIGSLPGRIIKAIRDCGSSNPVMMLDEIDKVGADFRGDPASALLEVLDPEQNSTFTDHYLDMPFDLSKVMFITTANVLDTIPPPLRDRMEILRISGYTTQQKVHIAQRYLIQRAYDNTGIEPKNARIPEDGLLDIIENYTREAGVRNLEREIGNIFRKVARRVASGKPRGIRVTPRRVRELLGPPRVHREMGDRAGQPGVSTGLAWTQTGGEILFIEATAIPGNGQLLLTGQLGDVMKESAMAALNYLYSSAEVLQIPQERFQKQNFHIHVPAGATPKDGPSAGVAMAAALCSLLTNTAPRDSLAMTGEITLKGNVLVVGGIKEKVLAAHRAGVTDVILPARNRDELEKDVPEEIRKALTFHYAEHISDVLKAAFPKQTAPAKAPDAEEVSAKLAEVLEEPAEKVAAEPAAEPEAAPIEEGVTGKVLRVEPDQPTSRRTRRSRSDRGRKPEESRAPKQEMEEEEPPSEESKEVPEKKAEKTPDAEDRSGEKPDAERRSSSGRSRRGSRGRGRRSSQKSDGGEDSADRKKTSDPKGAEAATDSPPSETPKAEERAEPSSDAPGKASSEAKSDGGRKTSRKRSSRKSTAKKTSSDSSSSRSSSEGGKATEKSGDDKTDGTTGKTTTRRRGGRSRKPKDSSES